VCPSLIGNPAPAPPMAISLGGFTWETYHTTYIHVHNTVLRYYLVLIIKEASTLSEEDKVQFKSYLSKRTDRRFREFVAQKNPLFLKGQLSCEAERALIEYMDRRGPAEFSENRTHTHTLVLTCARQAIVKLTSTSTKRSNSWRQYHHGL